MAKATGKPRQDTNEQTRKRDDQRDFNTIQPEEHALILELCDHRHLQVSVS